MARGRSKRWMVPRGHLAQNEAAQPNYSVPHRAVWTLTENEIMGVASSEEKGVSYVFCSFRISSCCVYHLIEKVNYFENAFSVKGLITHKASHCISIGWHQQAVVCPAELKSASVSTLLSIPIVNTAMRHLMTSIGSEKCVVRHCANITEALPQT